MKASKGKMVRYVCKIDFDLNDEVPNIFPAICTKVRPAADGKPESVALHVFTPSGGFVDEYVLLDENKARGTYHFAGCEE